MNFSSFYTECVLFLHQLMNYGIFVQNVSIVPEPANELDEIFVQNVSIIPVPV